jgi:RimJ/RimL family protein N-acetyltransferase
MLNSAGDAQHFFIRPLNENDVGLYIQHFARHRAESGRGDYHFMPFNPDDPSGPKGVSYEKLNLELTQPGWQRYWVACRENPDCIVGHVNLKGASLVTALHRCELGIGIERNWRAQGLGKRLMTVAIEFARQAPSLSWIDLGVFAHNQNAVALYRRMGFQPLVTMQDRFRIEGNPVADTLMTLSVD